MSRNCHSLQYSQRIRIQAWHCTLVCCLQCSTEAFSCHDFSYPMPTSRFVCVQVQYREEYKSFTHFITSVCAIVGGVFTVSGLIDSFIYHGQKVGLARQAYGVFLLTFCTCREARKSLLHCHDSDVLQPRNELCCHTFAVTVIMQLFIAIS